MEGEVRKTGLICKLILKPPPRLTDRQPGFLPVFLPVFLRSVTRVSYMKLVIKSIFRTVCLRVMVFVPDVKEG
jgi:hypothetical protein